MPQFMIIALVAALTLSGCGGGGSAPLAPDTTASRIDRPQDIEGAATTDTEGRVIATPPATQPPTLTNTTPAGTPSDSGASAPVQKKVQDGILIKGTWQQHSTTARPRFNLAALFESLFISTAYAETGTVLGTSTYLREVAPLQNGSFQILTESSGWNVGPLNILVTNPGSSSTWKSLYVATPGGAPYDYHHARLLADPQTPGHSFVMWIANSNAKDTVYLSEVTPDANGIPNSVAALSNFSGHLSMKGTYSFFDDAAMRKIPASGDTLVAAAIAMDDSYNHLGSADYTCEPTVIAVYNTTSANWQKVLIPCEDEIKTLNRSAGYVSLDFDAHGNLIVFRTSLVPENKSHILSGHKIPYNTSSKTFGQPVTIVKKTIDDSYEGFMQFKANPAATGSDNSEGYVLAFLTNKYLTGKDVDITVPADCSEPDAIEKPMFFYFMDKCYKVKTVQEKHHQAIVYKLDTSDPKVLKEIDTIPLLGWMGNWGKHNITTTTDTSNGFQFIIAINQEDAKYPPVIARYSEDKTTDTLKTEYFDSTGLALGSELFLTSQDQTLMAGTWLMVNMATQCNSAGFCTSGSYALGSTVFEFTPDDPPTAPPVQDPYGTPPPAQDPYGTPPPQDPYSVPPPQDPYGQ